MGGYLFRSCLRNGSPICVMGKKIAIDDDARKLRLLEWLTTPPSERKPAQLKQLAEEMGVTDRALRIWKADPSFRARWEKEAKDAVGEPGKVQEVIDMLRLGALDPNETLASRTRAADVYLRAVDGIKPPQMDVAAKKAAELTDAELEAIIAEAAQKELKARADG